MTLHIGNADSSAENDFPLSYVANRKDPSHPDIGMTGCFRLCGIYHK